MFSIKETIIHIFFRFRIQKHAPSHLVDFKLLKYSGIMLEENVYTYEFHETSNKRKSPHILLDNPLVNDFVTFRRPYDEVYHALHPYSNIFSMAVKIFCNTVLINKALNYALNSTPQSSRIFFPDSCS